MRTITTLSLSLLSFLILLIGQIHAICSWNPSATNCTSLVGRGISLEASQYANYYLRHRTLDKTLDPPNSVWVDLYPPIVPNANYLYNSGILTNPLLLDDTCFQIVSGLCARVDTPTYNTAIGLNDASFKVVAGLCGIANTLSFQSVDPPGYYLRQKNFYLYVQPLANDDGYKNDACFFQQPPLSAGNSSYFSFESVSYPGYFITQQNSRGMIAPNPGPNGTWITTGPINSPPIVPM